jgi:hypothetical protein
MELNFNGIDLCAINGTRSKPETRYDVVVVGAGQAGLQRPSKRRRPDRPCCSLTKIRFPVA